VANPWTRRLSERQRLALTLEVQQPISMALAFSIKSCADTLGMGGDPHKLCFNQL